MFITWFLLAPIGFILARFLKKFTWWFNAHRILMSIVTLLCLIGFALGVKGSPTHFDHFHKVLGLLIFIMSLAQPIIGVLADRLFDPNRDKVPIFPDKIHWVLGWVTIFCGMLNIAIGLGYYSGTKKWVLAIYIVLFIIYVCALVGYSVFRIFRPLDDIGHTRSPKKEKEVQFNSATPTPEPVKQLNQGNRPAPIPGQRASPSPGSTIKPNTTPSPNPNFGSPAPNPNFGTPPRIPPKLNQQAPDTNHNPIYDQSYAEQDGSYNQNYDQSYDQNYNQNYEQSYDQNYDQNSYTEQPYEETTYTAPQPNRPPPIPGKRATPPVKSSRPLPPPAPTKGGSFPVKRALPPRT